MKEKLLGERHSRWNRVAENQKENFPLALAVLWGCALVGGQQTVVIAAFLGYSFFRLGFMLC